MVVADGVGGDDANAWRKLGDRLRCELFGQRDEQRVLVPAAGHEFVSAHDMIVFVQVHTVVAPRALDHRRAQHTRNQEFRLRHYRLPLLRATGYTVSASSAGPSVEAPPPQSGAS